MPVGDLHKNMVELIGHYFLGSSNVSLFALNQPPITPARLSTLLPILSLLYLPHHPTSLLSLLKCAYDWVLLKWSRQVSQCVVHVSHSPGELVKKVNPWTLPQTHQIRLSEAGPQELYHHQVPQVILLHIKVQKSWVNECQHFKVDAFLLRLWEDKMTQFKT